MHPTGLRAPEAPTAARHSGVKPAVCVCLVNSSSFELHNGLRGIQHESLPPDEERRPLHKREQEREAGVAGS